MTFITLSDKRRVNVEHIQYTSFSQEYKNTVDGGEARVPVLRLSFAGEDEYIMVHDPSDIALLEAALQDYDITASLKEPRETPRYHFGTESSN